MSTSSIQSEGRQKGGLSATDGPLRIRPAAVAGLFYPQSKKALARQVDRLLSDAPEADASGLRALIVPHAGYDYSGPTAACAYKLLAGRAYRTVIIMAASHYAEFTGVCVPAVAAYETPLGTVPVSPLARELAGQKPFTTEPSGRVERPSWAPPAPTHAADTPETWEHSVEVQVPFLQRTLTDFAILPVVFGDAAPEAVAQRLAPLVDEQTLVITSTDLSHYHAYDEAQARDWQCVEAICALDLERVKTQEACGRMPVLALLHLAKLKNWRATLLDCRNSGDTAGDRRRVVGYAAIGFFDQTATAVGGATEFSEVDRNFLLQLVRRTIRSVTSGGGLPEVPDSIVPAACRAERGCFVTLTAHGRLRGCIGSLSADQPLPRAVAENARNAALRDSRFSPVTADEVDELHIEISVLTEPRPLKFQSPDDLLAKLHPLLDGVVLKLGARRATFLPQVWEQLPDQAEFLNHLSAKAGCAADAWRGPEVSVSTYRVEAFAEPGEEDHA
jgi:AmmeMemoRadiSam system protein B/AmmeMemoRadiSam system protein A